MLRVDSCRENGDPALQGFNRSALARGLRVKFETARASVLSTAIAEFVTMRGSSGGGAYNAGTSSHNTGVERVRGEAVTEIGQQWTTPNEIRDVQAASQQCDHVNGTKMFGISVGDELSEELHHREDATAACPTAATTACRTTTVTTPCPTTATTACRPPS